MRAQEPAGPPPGRPLLEQLNRETQALYAEAVRGLVRVELPTPRWASAAAQREELLNRWPKLSDEVKRELARAGDAPAATQPANAPGATQPTTGPAASSDESATVLVVPPSADAADPEREAVVGGRLEINGRVAGAFEPNNVGVLLDDAGHVLVPLHVEPEAARGRTFRAAGADGMVRDAAFVGSDKHTNLTVLKLKLPQAGGADTFGGSAVRLSRARPAEGSIVLYVEPHGGSARLGIWTGAASDLGIVFTTDCEAAGIARYGQFLNGPACRLIADQIIRHGEVKRPRLGVMISEIREDDPLRRRVPVLGNRTAMRIEQVLGGSAAQAAGLRAGDLLMSLAGEAVEDIPSLAAAIATRSGRTELQILRDGAILEVVVELRRE